MRKNIYKWEYNQFGKNERGFTLIEALVALAIMGLFAVVYLASLQTLAITNPIDEERVTATRLARSQMESVKMQGYQDSKIYTKITDPTTEQGYYYIDEVNADWYISSTGEVTEVDDTGIQKITVTVYKGPDASGKKLIELEGLIQ